MNSFFFYDLETTGVKSREGRIMQFGGQRTDMDLKPIDKPINILIKLTDDILPDPDAILITGISPQKTIQNGITELEFVNIFEKQINSPGTIFVGFNNIRFDDEFMRFLFWRNFYDPYEWQWKNENSRWDILDLSRITRALRPEGINWPFDSSGKPSNRLEFLTNVNKLEHSGAHDALSDVNATIAVARLIKQKQPKLFDYMLKLRNKKAVIQLIENNEIFIYSSGKYVSEFEKTTVVTRLGKHPDNNGYLVYDLRDDPGKYIDLSPAKLADLWKWKKDNDEPRLPVKSLQPNRCPAIAPILVLDKDSETRLKLDLKTINSNLNKLQSAKDFYQKLIKALEILNKDRTQTNMMISINDVDGLLYDNFVPDVDKKRLEQVRTSNPNELAGLGEKFSDERLKLLVPLFKARNYFNSLNDQERVNWDNFRRHSLLGGGEKSRFAQFSNRLSELAKDELGNLSDEKKYLLKELHLYAESILPEF